MLHRDPRLFGIDCSRWRLADLFGICDWLKVTNVHSLCTLLHRLNISWKRGRTHLHSPDLDYQEKVAFINNLIHQARSANGKIVVLFLDELTYYRQPTLANAWERGGHYQALAKFSHRTNTPTRVIATLDSASGRVLHRRRKTITLTVMVHFYNHVRQMYPEAEKIYIVLDNWPTHFHPDVLLTLESQENIWPYHRPGNWPTEATPTAVRRYGKWQLPVQLVPLPTYAPWTNPIEKLWRKLKQEVLHMHQLANSLDALRVQADTFLDQYANGSLDLLRYVGIAEPNSKGLFIPT